MNRSGRCITVVSGLAVILALASGCAQTADESSSVDAADLGTVTVAELKEITDQDSTAWVIDVRRPEEYRQVHIPPVKQLIVHTEITQSQAELPADKDEPIYLICRTGRRSGIAGRELIELGYTHVFNVAGGTTEWVQEGFPADSGTGILAPPSAP